MRKSIFMKTQLSHIEDAIMKVFPAKGINMLTDAESILSNEYKTYNNRSNRVIAKHLKKNILPGYAVYRAIINSGETEEAAIEFVQKQMSESIKKTAEFTAKLSHKKYTYFLVRYILKFFLRFAYPKEGWTCEIIEDSKSCVRFNMTSCLYLEELEKRGAKNLCPAFCHTDVVAYSPLAPATSFIREGTLAQTGVKCDFCFRRGL